MKASELRIGNTIGQEGHTHTVTSDTIKFLEQAGDGITGFHRITLTEKWLVKFGYKPRLCGEYFNHKSDGDPDDICGTRLTLTERRGVFFFNVVSDVYNGYEVEIKYVNQLQNLYFALTGEELTIQE